MPGDEKIQAILDQIANLPEDVRTELVERLIEARLHELGFDRADEGGHASPMASD